MRHETVVSNFIAREIYREVVKQMGRRKGLRITLGYPDITTTWYWYKVTTINGESNESGPRWISFKGKNHVTMFLALVGNTTIRLTGPIECNLAKTAIYQFSDPGCLDAMCRDLGFHLDLEGHTIVTTWWERFFWWFSYLAGFDVMSWFVKQN